MTDRLDREEGECRHDGFDLAGGSIEGRDAQMRSIVWDSTSAWSRWEAGLVESVVGDGGGREKRRWKGGRRRCLYALSVRVKTR